jgi:hypothetical protein
MKKYTLYAIGEIALVVIGILIALQINNWNENRKEIEIEQKLLLSLQREISTNIVELEKNIKGHTNSSELTKELLKYFSSPRKSQDVEYIDSIVENVSTPSFYNPQMGVIKSMISTGEVNFIRNDSIVEFVSMFEDENAQISKQAERMTKILC